jgi:hypothetical protein
MSALLSPTDEIARLRMPDALTRSVLLSVVMSVAVPLLQAQENASSTGVEVPGASRGHGQARRRSTHANHQPLSRAGNGAPAHSDLAKPPNPRNFHC